MKMKVKPDYLAVAYCGYCGCVSAMAWATTPKDSREAIKDMAAWTKDGRKVAVIKKKKEDPMPLWCGCELVTDDDEPEIEDRDDSWHLGWERDNFGDS